VRVIENGLVLNPAKILVVVGQYKPVIEQTLEEWGVLDKINFAIQEIPKGTGHAILCTLDQLPNNEGSYNLILNGDCPMLTSETMQDMVNCFETNNSELQIACIELENPHGSGRIIKDDDGNFLKIVEEKDCNDEERETKLINIGIYMARNNVLKECIPKIDNNNAQNEYYLTDIVEIYRGNGSVKQPHNPDGLLEKNNSVGLVELDQSKFREVRNVNTREQLEALNLE